MKAIHSVKINGTWYREGSEIPSLPSNNASQKVEAQESAETKEPEKITRSKITLMKTADLRELLKQNGVEDTENVSGAEMKLKLYEIYGV